MSGEFGFGTKLAKGSTPVDVAQVTSIGGPSYSLETVDVTAHDSSTSYYREYVPGLLDAGEVSLELNFDPNGATHKAASDGLIYTMEQRTNETWKITFVDTTTCTFTGYLTKFEPSAPFDDKLTASAAIKVSGKPTWAYA